jgi:hypothetical protein
MTAAALCADCEGLKRIDIAPDGVILSTLPLGFARLAIAAVLLMLVSTLVLGRALWAIPTRLWL